MSEFERAVRTEQAKAYVREMAPASWNFPQGSNVEYDLALQLVTGQHWHRSGYIV